VPRLRIDVGIAHRARIAFTNCSSVRSPWTNCSKRSRASAVGARPSRRRSETAFSTASRRRRLSETAIVLGAAAVDMDQVYHGDQGAPTSRYRPLMVASSTLSIAYKLHLCSSAVMAYLNRHPGFLHAVTSSRETAQIPASEAEQPEPAPPLPLSITLSAFAPVS
jgi:hypothetical protein